MIKITIENEQQSISLKCKEAETITETVEVFKVILSKFFEEKVDVKIDE
jgi:hypothetical protein